MTTTTSQVTLQADTKAQIIPDGDEVILKAGDTFAITQALGGTATLRGSGGLFRVQGADLDALGPEAAAEIRATAPVATAGATGDFSEDTVWNALKACFDPEIPVNIVDLGLIYDLALSDGDGGKHVDVKMTLTARGCGMGPTIAADAQSKIEAIPEVTSANVEIVWDPQWTPHMISKEGRAVLGI